MAEKFTVLVMVAEAPIVMMPDRLLPDIMPLAPVPRAPDEMVGAPNRNNLSATKNLICFFALLGAAEQLPVSGSTSI